MGIGFGSRYKNSVSSFDTPKKVVEVTAPLPNPNPSNYEIIQYFQYFTYLILFVKYPDCKNYEGNKILVFKNCNISALEKQKLIDPHFSQNPEFYSPIARFEPTEYGWNLAIELVKLIKEKKII